MAAEAYGYQPVRVALCTCGWAFRGKTLAVVNEAVNIHMDTAVEGCDHAIYIETLTLPNAVAR